jgi:hypothetical protein
MCAILQAISISEREHEKAISHGILSKPMFRDLFAGMWPRELPSEESKVRRWQERYEVSILDAYIATAERSDETEIPQQRRGEVLQQSVKKLIARPIVRTMSCVNGGSPSAAETALYEIKDDIRRHYNKHQSTATYFCKTSIAEHGSESSIRKVIP